MPDGQPLRRIRMVVHGTVQGVGFRPFVYRLATQDRLTGWVRNDGRAVTIELQGTSESLARFPSRLVAELPLPGRIDRLSSEDLLPRADEQRFEVAESLPSAGRSLTLAPDGWVCADCLRELGDPSDRRFRYPFINCTHCGPRYTITRELPYDRPNTTMAPFVMCEACRNEYSDPADRRFHAQPIACAECGPRAWLVVSGQDRGEGGPRRQPRGLPHDPAADVVAAGELLAAGKTVAIKGIGGFHLAVTADEQAIVRLRQYKKRARKPLAVMARDLEVARQLVVLDEATTALLCSPAAPIVLAPARDRDDLCRSLAPGLGDVGVMLPYSPLHHLLFSETSLEVLVMTSGNHPSEPITTTNADALADLGADAWLLHDRPIHVACDDSVVRSAQRRPLPIRRARGHVPQPLDARFLPSRNVLALGAELKLTVATLSAGELAVGRHLGDLDNPRAEAAFRQEIDRMLAFGRVEPELIAVDLHPDLLSTVHAETAFATLPLVRVQHHHAHLAAVLVEHGRNPSCKVAGIILDGLGYGPDGTVWGGEVLLGGYAHAERWAHLRPVPQPGGDRAAVEPARMATSLLIDCGQPDHPACNEQFASICSIESVSPLSSSTGRLFDGVAAILAIAPDKQDYLGEAAARLEAIADPCCSDAYPLPLRDGQLDTRELVAALIADQAPNPLRAARFHNGLADGLAQAALETGANEVVLGGGCMVNRLLSTRLESTLTARGVCVLTARVLPPGDGGLSAGQAAAAACIVSEQE